METIEKIMKLSVILILSWAAFFIIPLYDTINVFWTIAMMNTILFIMYGWKILMKKLEKYETKQ